MVDVKNIQLGAPIEYDYLGIKRRMDLILTIVSLGGRHLDVGCGNGAQTLKFLKYVDSCVAIDVEKNRLNIFKQKLRELGLNNCEVKQMDATNLEFKDETFDIITHIETLEHVPDQEKVLDEMYRVLKRGGLLILSVPNKWWIFETHGAKLPLLPWNRVPFFSWMPKKIHDEYACARIYTKKEIVDLLESHKFNVVATDYLMPPLDKVRNKNVRKFFRYLLFRLEKTSFRFFGVSIFTFSRKN